MGVTEILCSFRLVLEGETCEGTDSSRLEFLEMFLGKYFVLSGAEDNNSELLNREGIADLPLLRTLLAICQRSQGPSFWEVMDSFVFLAYASLAAPRTLLQWLLAYVNVIIYSDLFCWYKPKKWFLWTMTAAQATENHGDGWGLSWYLQGGIYTSIAT